MTEPKTSRHTSKVWLIPRLEITIPRIGTHAQFQYFESYVQVNSFLDYVMSTTLGMDKTAEIAHKALVATSKNELEKAQLIESWSVRPKAIDAVKEFSQFLLEIVLVRHVENYLNYLSLLLKEIFLARPETLRSSEKIDLETVLRHGSIEDLVVTVAERKVETLSYTSFSDLASYFSERLGINLVADTDINIIVDSIETRNISVHNRCIVNQRYVSRTGRLAEKLGELRVLGIDGVESMIEAQARSVILVDRTARSKLKIAGHRAPSGAKAK